MSKTTLYKKKSAKKKVSFSCLQLEFKKVLEKNMALEKEIEELKSLLTDQKMVSLSASTAKKRRSSGSPTKEYINHFAILDEESIVEMEVPKEKGDLAVDTNINESSINIAESSIIDKMVNKNIQRKTKASNEVKNSSNTITAENKDENNKITKREEGKMPPINVYNQESRDLTMLMKNVVSKNFIIKKSGKRHSITVFCKIDYSSVKGALEKANAPYYTYTPKDEKHKTFLLKGLDNSYTPADVLEELKSLAIENLNFINAFRFETNKSKKEKKILSSIVVQLTPDSKSGALRDIRYLFNHVVHWEEIKRQSSIQCHNCQRFTHTSGNCHMEHRCVKCGCDHDVGKCSLNESSDRTQLYCILCKEHGHPASYGGCKAHMALKEKLRQRTLLARENTKEKEQMFQNRIEKGVSFADQLRGTKSSNITGIVPPTPKKTQLEDIKSAIMSAMKTQFEHLAKTLEVQSNRIDTLFDIIGNLDSNE